MRIIILLVAVGVLFFTVYRMVTVSLSNPIGTVSFILVATVIGLVVAFSRR